MSWRRTTLAWLLAAAVLAVPGTADAAMRWGINPGMAGADDLAGSTYARQAAAAMAAIGLREARYIAPWSTADPLGTADAPGGSYVWSTYFDTVATVLAQNRIRWNPVFAYPPYVHSADPTGVGGANPTVSSYPHFANFVEAFARRYGPGGRFWSENPSLPAVPVTDYEIWNEPNLPGVWANAAAAPQEYMDLYATAYSAIKRVDSGARVMFGAFTPSPGAWNESWFLAASVAHRPQQPIDAVSYHPNTIGIGTYGAVDHVYRLIRPLRAQMDALGLDDVPMSITELAWGSDYSIFPDSAVRLTESERAAAMTTVGRALANSDCNINMVAMLYWGTDREVASLAEDPRRYIPTVFALANPDNSLKPIGQAYRDVIQEPPGEQQAICHPDVEPPETTITDGPSGLVASSVAAFGFASSESGGGFECRLDGGGWAGCASPRELAGLSDGEHALSVRAVDRAGNADPTPAVRSWEVDTQAPETAIEGGPTGVVGSASAAFAFTSSESGGGFECRLDGGEWAGCASPRELADLADGGHSVSVRAVDRAGNADPTPAGRSWEVDTRAPETTITEGPAGTTGESTPTLRFGSTEAGSEFACSVDGRPFARCVAPLLLAPLADGRHTFRVRARDRAGNTDPTAAAREFSVDTTSAGAERTETVGTIETALASDLTSSVRRLRRLRSGLLLRRGGLMVGPLRALVKGRFSAKLLSAGRGRRATLAAGTCRAEASRTCRVRLLPTRRGRRLARQRVRIDAKLRIAFTDASNRLVTQVARISLRR